MCACREMGLHVCISGQREREGNGKLYSNRIIEYNELKLE